MSQVGQSQEQGVALDRVEGLVHVGDKNSVIFLLGFEQGVDVVQLLLGVGDEFVHERGIDVDYLG